MFKARIAILLGALFIVGIVMTITGVSDLIKMNGNVPDFNYESMQDIKKGDMVQGYIYNIDGCYANTTTTETTMGIETDSYISEEYFLMPLINDPDYEQDLYITIVAKNKTDRDTLYDICDATWEFYEGNENVVFPDMGIVAKVKKLGSEYEGFLLETLVEAQYYTTESEARQHIIPYALVIYNPKSAYTSLGIGLVIVIAFAVVGIILFNKIKKERTPEPSFSASSAATDNFTVATKPSEDGFDESYIPPQPMPMPDIPQPVQPDAFFERQPKPAAPVAEPEPAPVAATSEAVAGNMDELDTSGLFDDADYETDTDTSENEFIE